MNDTQLIERLLDELNIKSREDLLYWIENFSEGYECDHWYGMVYDDGYRIETEAEKEIKRANARAVRRTMQRRWNAGDRGMDMLLWKTMDSYIPLALDNIFTARPLLYTLMGKNDEQENLKRNT